MLHIKRRCHFAHALCREMIIDRCSDLSRRFLCSVPLALATPLAADLLESRAPTWGVITALVTICRDSLVAVAEAGNLGRRRSALIATAGLD